MSLCFGHMGQPWAEFPGLHVIKDSFTQAELEAIASEHGAYLVERHLICEEWDDDVALNLGALGPFPKLRSLKVECLNLCELVLTKENFPLLTVLDIKHAHGIKRLSLDLPELALWTFWHAKIDDASDFGPSIARSPGLAHFDGYRVWGLGGWHHYLYLPNAHRFKLARGDDVTSLDVYGPRLTSLYLAACFGLMRLRIHHNPLDPQKIPEFVTRADKARFEPGPNVFTHWNEDIEAVLTKLMGDAASSAESLEEPKVVVDLCNAGCMDPMTLHHLQHHPRVGRRNVERVYPEPGGGMSKMLGDPFSDSDSDESDSEEEEPPSFEAPPSSNEGPPLNKKSPRVAVQQAKARAKPKTKAGGLKKGFLV